MYIEVSFIRIIVRRHKRTAGHASFRTLWTQPIEEWSQGCYILAEDRLMACKKYPELLFLNRHGLFTIKLAEGILFTSWGIKENNKQDIVFTANYRGESSTTCVCIALGNAGGLIFGTQILLFFNNLTDLEEMSSQRKSFRVIVRILMWMHACRNTQTHAY